MKIIKNVLGLSLLTGITAFSSAQEWPQRTMSDEANHRIDSARLTDPMMRPRLSASNYESQPSMARESMRLPVRSFPDERTDMRDYYDDGTQTFDSRGFRERTQRTYIISRDDQGRVEQTAPVYTRQAPVYTRPKPVERVIYREPVYNVRPEVIIQREVEYVPMPERYVELPRRNLDGRRVINESPLVSSAPLRGTERRVFVPQYEPLAEPPRFYRERNHGMDPRIGTSLSATTIYDRRAFDDRVSAPMRYDYSRMPPNSQSVRYIGERVVTSEIRDPFYEYRSTLQPTTRSISGYEDYREPLSRSMLRETDLPRYYYTPHVSSEPRRSLLVDEENPLRYDRMRDMDMERRSRLVEDEMMLEREIRVPIREREIRVPVRERDFRNTLQPTYDDGLPSYYNGTEEEYLKPKYNLGQAVEFKRAQYQPQANPYIQPNDRDRRQPRELGRPEQSQLSGQANRTPRALLPQGYVRPKVVEHVRPADSTYARMEYRDDPFPEARDYARMDERDFARSRSYTLPAQSQAMRERGDIRELQQPETPANTYTRPTERQHQSIQPQPYSVEPRRSEVPETTSIAATQRQYVQPRTTYLPEDVRSEASAPVYIRPGVSQSMPAQSSSRELYRQSAQAPTEPLRFEDSSPVVNRPPDEERRRTYTPAENVPMTVPAQVQSLPLQSGRLNREIMVRPQTVPATESTTLGRTYVTPKRTPVTRTPVTVRPQIESFPRQPSRLNREILTQPRAVPAAQPPIIDRTFRRPVARAPLPLRTAERIQGYPFAADPVFNSDAYNRALQGKSAIADQLRPELVVDFGYENDTDGFDATHIGGRYNHFSRAGNLYYLGLSFDNYSEEDAVPFDSVNARSLLFGASGFLNEKLRGFADFSLTDFSEGPDLSFSITAGGSYNFDGVNTLTASYSRFDFFREAKTVRSLLEDISADRFRLDWTSNPIEEAEGRPFGERVYFEGSLAFTNLSDNNTSLSYSLRPYYRIADDPNIDVSVGWQGLSYENQSPFYYSPDNISGPTLGARISGETLWELLYDVRGFVSFPTQENSSRSLQASLRKNFTNNFSAGTNIFLTEAPRANDDDYRFGSIFFDLRYQF